MRQVTEEFTRVLTARLAAEPDPLMRLRLYIRSHLQMTSRYHVKAGMGLRRQMSGAGASHLTDHAGMVGEVLIGILDEAMDRSLIAQQNTLGAVHLIHATLAGQRLPNDEAHRESALAWWRPSSCEAWAPPRRTCATSPLPRFLPGNRARALPVESDRTQGPSGPD